MRKDGYRKMRKNEKSTTMEREGREEAEQTLMIDKKTLEGSRVPPAIWLYRISSAREGEERGRGRRGREAR